jgi:multidrug efflux pump subunit AcrA (membrane-fusion protein)
MSSSPSHRVAQEVVKIALPILILLAGAAGVALVMALKKEPASAAVEKTEATVETVAIQPHHQGIDIQVDGLVVPFREPPLSAEVAGRVKEVSELCRAGKFVREGDLLVQIDPADYELEVERLNRELDQAVATIEETQVELASTRQLVPLVKQESDLQQKQLDRLLKLGSGVSTEKAIDEARRSGLAAQNALIQLEQKVLMTEKREMRLEHARDLVKAQLARAQLDLERCRITAPVDGIVVSESVEEDAFVQKGTELVTVEDTSSIEVRCNLRLEDLNWLWRQQRNRPTSSEVDLQAFDASSRDYQLPHAEATVLWELGGRQFAWKARLDRYDGIGVNQKTRTAPCVLVVDRPRDVLEVQNGDPRDLAPAQGGPPALVRGMYVQVRIHCQPATPLVRLPERAIRPGNIIWLLRDGRLAFEKVQIAAIDREVAVLDATGAPFQAGDKVVVSPLAYAHAGMEVKEKPSQPEAGPRAEVASDPSRSKS